MMIGRLSIRLLNLLAVAALGLLLSPTEIAAEDSKPLGHPFEDPEPWSSARATRDWYAAHWRGDLALAERLARAMVDRANRPDRKVAPRERVEAHLALGQTLDARKRHSEAEDQYRVVREEIAAALRPGGAAAARRVVVAWEPYADYYLRACLRHQLRLREAERLPRLMPVAANPDAQAEVAGIGGIAGIATDAYVDPDLRARLGGAERVVTYQQLADAVGWRALGQPPETVVAAHRALIDFAEQYLGTNDAVVGRHRAALAAYWLDYGNPEAAAAEAAAALAIAEQMGTRRDQASARLVLGSARLSLRQWQGAQQVLRAAEPDADATQQTDIRVMLGASSYHLRQLDDAANWYRLAAADTRLPPAFRREIGLFLGRIAMERGNVAAAAAITADLCSEIGELVQQATRGIRATSRTDGPMIELRRCAEQQLAALAAQSAAPEAVGATLSDALLAMQGAHIDATALRLSRSAARAHARRRGVAEIADRFEALVAERDALDAQPGEQWPLVGRTRTADYDSTAIAQLDAQIGELSNGLANVAPRYWALRMQPPVSLSELIDTMGNAPPLLHRDEALVAFHFSEDGKHGYVLAVSAVGQAFTQLSAGSDTVAAMVNRLRAQIDPEAYGLRSPTSGENPAPLPFDLQLAHELYLLLLGAPEVSAVIGSARSLLFVPSGPLVALPPALLITRQPAPGSSGEDPASLRAAAWLVRSHAITVLPSVGALRNLRRILPQEGMRPGQPLLALVDPEYGAPPDSIGRRAAGFPLARLFVDGTPNIAELRRLGRLRFAAQEGEALRVLTGADTSAVLSGADASKAALMARDRSGALADVRILDFATHGFAAGPFDGQKEPFLVLAAADEPQDWVLRASEVAELALNADWVILSGCNTGSPNYGARGLSGFMEAFTAAGARSLLVSHWRVHDPSAAVLVPATIAAAERDRMDGAAALQSAMLAMLDDPDRQAEHPFFWAPFTLVGDPGRRAALQ